MLEKFEKPSKIRKIESDCVKLILHNFIITNNFNNTNNNRSLANISESNRYLLIDKLKFKKHKFIQPPPCLLLDSLENVRYKTSLAYDFRFPCDVKISHGAKLIIVSDTDHKKLVFFDLQTLEYLNGMVLSFNPFYLVVEESDDSSIGDNLIVGGNGNIVFKMKLNVADSDKPLAQMLWFSERSFNDIQGLTIRYGNDGNFIYVCDRFNDRIVIMKSSDGTIVRSVTSINVFNLLTQEMETTPIIEPFSIEMDVNRGTILLSFKYSLFLISEDVNNNSFTLLKKLTPEADNPSHMALDQESRNLIIADERNHRMIILNIDSGLMVKTFGKFGDQQDPYTFNCITGFCLNRRNGSVFISDCENHQIKIFTGDD